MRTQSQSPLDKKNRISFLFWIFFLLSFPVVIIVVGYAAGFRYNPSIKQLTPSAGISIDTVPNNAIVSLNGEPLEEQTPVVETITPGYYSIIVSKDGYFDWEKELYINENESILFPDIYLFLESESRKNTSSKKTSDDSLTNELLPIPSQLSEVVPSISSESIYSDGPVDIILDSTSSNLYVVDSIKDISDEKDIEIYNIPAATIEWNQRIALISSDNEIWLYDSRSDSFEILYRQTDKIHDVLWHPSGQYIIYSDIAGIHVSEIDNRGNSRQKWTLVYTSDATDLFIDTNEKDLYYTIGQSQYIYQLQDYSIFSK